MNYGEKKITEIILYILTKTGGVDQYHLFKIMYFAEMKHISKWGNRFIQDDFYAMKYGPVPSKIYDALKSIDHSLLSDNIKSAEQDASNTLIALRTADTRYISKSEIEVLDESIADNANLTFSQLMQKSHGYAWKEASEKRHNKINTIAMAKEMKVEDSMLAYINEQIELDEALR